MVKCCVYILLFSGLLIGCGSDSGGTEPAGLPGLDGEPVVAAAISFPPPVSLSSADSIIVKGTTSHANDAGISAVRVNGVAAVTSDAYAHWQAQIPLFQGNNTIIVEIEDFNQNIVVTEPQASVIKALTLTLPVDVVFDAASDQYIVLDVAGETLVGVDINNGHSRIISGRSANGVIGSGPLLDAPVRLVIDSDRNRAIVADYNLGLVAIDISTGDRSVLSGHDRGSGPELGDVIAVALDSNTNYLLLANRTERFVSSAQNERETSLMLVDMSSGDRTVLSDNLAYRDGPLHMNYVADIVLDSINNRALAVTFDFENSSDLLLNTTDLGRVTDASLLAIDLESGVRTVVSSSTRGDGAELQMPFDLVFDSVANRVFIVDAVVKRVLAVDLDNGNRSIISDVSLGEGVNPGFPFGLTFDQVNNTIITVGTSGLLRIDPVTGNRSIAAAINSGLGAGPKFNLLREMMWDSAHNRIVALDNIDSAIVAINLPDGERKVIAGAGIGQGPEFHQPLSLALDTTNNRIFMLDLVNFSLPFGIEFSLFNIDLRSGDRQQIHLLPCNNEVVDLGLSSIVWDVANQRLLRSAANARIISLFPPNATISTELQTIDITTGACERLSAIDPFSIEHLALGASDQILSAGRRITDFDLADSENIQFADGLFAANIAGGVSAIVSDDENGNGPALDDVTDLALALEGGYALVAQGNQVLKVDLSDGNRTVLIDGADGNGPAISNASSILLGENNTLWLWDSVGNALFLIDMENKQRVIVSK